MIPFWFVWQAHEGTKRTQQAAALRSLLNAAICRSEILKRVLRMFVGKMTTMESNQVPLAKVASAPTLEKAKIQVLLNVYFLT